ncbi:MAG: undecaprenyldiphospho-muramoylpentapeptide beta-N-acetylglucosaminyltransferase [Ruminococcaceae bacterium]|nr:undecaprenyldiphospho-muramoylpentapeptide beta-N-acetylglucosaminyltransferase [Oscillospiraceae bacterium]
MRVLVSGGGTGGHINPALAIADKIKKENPDAVIEYVGTQKGLESTLVPKAGYRIHFIKVKGFKRKLTLENFDALIKAFTSVSAAKKIIKQFKPDIVYGTGGYVCWPVLKAAAKMGIPTFVHESNAYPGVTTKMLSKYVDKIMFGFEESKKYLECDKNKMMLVGTPVSEKMLCANKENARKAISVPDDAKMVVSAGGSLGAMALNENAYELIKNYTLPNNIYHYHATGNAGWEEQSELYRKLGFVETEKDVLKKGNVTVCRYIYNMYELLPAADVAICRAGAMTLSELSILGKAAVIVPSPYVTNNHQFKNAKVLSDKDAAILIEEKNLDGKSLIKAVKSIIEDDEKRKNMENNVRTFAVTDTLDRIYGVVKELVK